MTVTGTHKSSAATAAPIIVRDLRARAGIEENMNVIDTVDAQSLKKDLPDFRAGDTVRVNVNIIEGNRSRIQAFQGVVLARRGAGLRETFVVRKLSFGIGVERTFPLHSPTVDSIDVISRGRVRRAKLYYLRDRHGKAARIREKRNDG